MPVSIKSLHTLRASEFLQIIDDSCVGLTFSQFGEDTVINHFLTLDGIPTYKGFYVDVGAFHPRMYSNTRTLTYFGWRGLNIDVNPDAIEMFKRERPNDINICCAVAEAEQMHTLYKFENAPAANTICREFAEKFGSETNFGFAEHGATLARPLNDILAENLPSGQAIDYMNIDVEGLDRTIVSGLDFDRYRPKILSIELGDADKLDLKNDETVRSISKNRYQLMAINYITYIFVDQSVL